MVVEMVQVRIVFHPYTDESLVLHAIFLLFCALMPWYHVSEPVCSSIFILVGFETCNKREMRADQQTQITS
jgi:hypothetical protein